MPPTAGHHDEWFDDDPAEEVFDEYSATPQQFHAAELLARLGDLDVEMLARLGIVPAANLHPPAPSTRAPRVSTWRKILDATLPADALHVASPVPDPDAATMGLLFEPIQGTSYRRSRPTRIGIRPVVRSAADNWVRSEISWVDVAGGYGLRGHDADVIAWFQSMADVAGVREAYGYDYGGSEWKYLDDLEGPLPWKLFAEAEDLGIPLLHGRKGAPPVIVSEREMTPLVAVTKEGRGARLSALTDENDALERFGLVGDAAVNGLYTWGDDAPTPGRHSTLTLVPFTSILDPALVALLHRGSVSVPAGELAELLSDYLPRVMATVPVRSPDGSIALPAPAVPTLIGQVRNIGPHALAVEWHWVYRTTDTDTAVVPLLPRPGERIRRDTDTEQRILEAVNATLALHSDIGTPLLVAGSGSLRPRAVVEGVAAARFVASVAPDLAAIPHVELTTRADVADYREPTAPLTIEVRSVPASGTRDWFDLSITVMVDGEEVPFDRLFVALARGDELLVLDSGVFVTLDAPELLHLRDLIGEARALHDAPTGTVRITSHQVDLWDELTTLGVVAEQSERWRAAVDRVRRFRDADPAALLPPAGLTATLRAYQHEGYGWLSGLADAGLGGILADDMGLGKTVQLLAMIARQREQHPDAPPFLVVAPTSVVGNWRAEARKFTPDLRIAIVEQLASRRGTSIAELTAECDILVTSYTLLRLEGEGYEAIEWAGVILDEAQFVKNHTTKAYRAVRQLRAPVKFVVTGTPMENNLLELWALLGIAAPGLFPSKERFTDFYRTPIEKEANADRLSLLHRRLQPLMLRRTKEHVATDLPPRIEQVIDVELSPAHRRLYDRYLQRERQKVLGLLGDMEKNRFEIFRSLTLLRRLSLDASLISDEHADVPATKIDVLLDMLETIIADGHRTLIFSQFTGFLDRVRARLDEYDIAYASLDGSTTRRADVIDGFRTGDAPVFLISLKSGGFGINLTEADYCILLDPWWNPAAERQAIDRAHRIGQTKTVMVYRFVATNTIEEKVMALKAGKAKLFDSVINEAELTDARLSAADIRSLLS